jgi:hypothetical protein
MTADLHKPFKRRSQVTARERGKHRRIIVTLYPAGFIGFRPEGTRREETLSIDAAYAMAIKSRVFRERMEKAKQRKASRGKKA